MTPVINPIYEPIGQKGENMGKYSQTIENHVDLQDIHTTRILLEILEEIRLLEEEDCDGNEPTRLYVVTQAESEGDDFDYTVADIVSSQEEAEQIEKQAASNQTRHVYEVKMVNHPPPAHAEAGASFLEPVTRQ